MFVMMFIINENAECTLVSPFQLDEHAYKTITQNIVSGNISIFNTSDNKTIPFIALQLLLKAYESMLYTRLLNVILIMLCTYLIYSITRRLESILFFVIPWYLNSMWLTVEIIEVFFVLLAMKYANKRGILIGIATLFRPYSLLYIVLLKKTQWIYVIAVGSIYAAILYYNNALFSYFTIVSNYSITGGHIFGATHDMGAIMLWLPFFYMGYKTQTFKYGMIASIPLLVQTFAHYFIPSLTFFFVGYLLELKDKNAYIDLKQ